jgi:DNA invertase Pin-like site-specific DNA recombinase
MRKYVAYYRISKDSHETGKSKAKGLGLESQRQIVEHFYGDQIVADFTETKSAKNITDRPILQQAIEYCIKNECWLVVAKLDRLSRNTIDALSIVQKLGKKVSFCDIPSEGEADEFMITIFAAIAQRERELISIRTSQALQIKIQREGKWNKGNPDFKNGNAQKLAVAAIKLKASENENTIRAAALISEKRRGRLSYAQIAKILNDNKFLSPSGGLFHSSQVRRIHISQ